MQQQSLINPLQSPEMYTYAYIPPTLTYSTYTYPSNFNNPRPPPSPPLTIPTRTLFLSLVPNYMTESTIRRDLEVFGEIRYVEMDRLHEGLVTVHFYDLEHATRALHRIQGQQ